MEDPIPTYTLSSTVSPAEAGKITASPSASTYPEGTQVTLTPEPNENWVFKQWEGDVIGNTVPLQVTMTVNKSIIGIFVKRDYPLNLKIEGEGTVDEKIVPNPSGREYPHGTKVELKPIPKEGWVFESWGGDLSGIETPQIITVDKEKNVIVKFKRKDYPLNLTITGEGTVEEKIISTPGGRTYPFQTIVQLTPKAKEGWEFESWGGDLTGKETPKNITVDKEKNVTVKFIKTFMGYKVAANARQLGTDYWENSILPSDLIVAVFQRNYENHHPLGAYAVWTEAICNGDFNNDGYMDVFNGGTAFGGQIKATVAFLIWNPLTKIFEEKNLINDKTNNIGHPRLVTPVYLNSDNYVDLVIHGMRDEGLNSSPNEPVSICLSDGKGGYDITKLDLEPKSLANQFGHEWGDVEDVSGDGLPDLFVSANSHSYIFWGINTFPYFTNINFAHFASDTKNFSSDNGFGEVVPSGAGAVYGGVFLDVNKDEQKDLLLAVGENGIQPNGNKDQQRVLLNKGKGRFNETGVIKLPLYSNQINSGINQFDYKVDDLNGDGRLDIIAINSVKYSQWNIVIYLQQSDGSFVIDTSLVEYNLNTISRPQYKTRLVYSDINGDGLKDISYINSSITPYYMLQNNELLTKSVFIRVGNKFVEKDYYQFDPYAKSLKDKYYK
jgi:hypothetical protein